MAMELAHNKEAGMLAGLVVSSMLGCTLVFSIPVGLGLIEYEDRPFFAKGLLIGLITIPFGGIIGGLIAGFNLSMVIINMIPVIILAVILAVGLKFNSTLMINGSLIFGKFISILITIGLGEKKFAAVCRPGISQSVWAVMSFSLFFNSFPKKRYATCWIKF